MPHGYIILWVIRLSSTPPQKIELFALIVFSYLDSIRLGILYSI